MTIKILPARLANQIAAGEVVERPASVIKELVENSIDAGATDILVEIDKGGHKRMLIRDNGKGIPKEELSLALSRHATSKIEDIDDLESITSLGFRGEALASISSVSRLTLSSKTQDQDEAWQAHCEGRDMEIQLNPTAHPKGASVEVLDLFFNTPARRKFLRAEKTEFQHVEEIFKRIALSHFEVGFTLKHNGRVIHRFPAVTAEIKERRIAAVCGQGFIQNSISLHGEYQNVTVTGWCNAVGQGRSTNDMQYSFVNGRMMKDRVILHAIRQAFEGMIESQTYPAFVIFITMAPEELDINVHPAKHEVRFHRSREVHDLIYKSVSDALLLNASTDGIEFETSEQENNVTSLYEVPKHAYQQPTDQSASADYIAPLRQDSGAGYTPRAKGFESAVSKGAYAGTAIKQGAAHQYQNLMTPGRPPTEDDPQRQSLTFLLTESKQLVFTQNNSVQFLPAYYLLAHVLLAKINASDVQQPLLMPVSVKTNSADDKIASEKSALQQDLQGRIKLLADVGFDIQSHANKLILKQVPASLRQLPWVSILPMLINAECVLRNEQDLLRFICFCWAQSYTFTYSELQHWFSDIPASEQQRLIDAHASAIAVPNVSFSVSEQRDE